MTNRNRVVKCTLIVLASLACFQVAQAETANASAVINVIPNSSQPLPSNQATPQSTTDELQSLIQQHALTEMRTSYDGSYGASLLFDIHTGLYFIALFQQKAFWRVIKTADETRAESVYADFSRQAYTLASGELQAARLQSQKELMSQQITTAQDRASQLQADLQIAHQQQAVVADHQRTTHAEAAQLKSQTSALQAQLRALQDQVHALQRQANSGLPTNTAQAQ